VPAPIAWNGLVFIGNGGGDLKNANGRRTRVYPVDSTRLPQVADVKETDAALPPTKRPTSNMARAARSEANSGRPDITAILLVTVVVGIADRIMAPFWHILCTF
jgi:hypothetical protein